MRETYGPMMANPVSRSPEQDKPMPKMGDTVASYLTATTAELRRASDILETIISQVEGSGEEGDGMEKPCVSNLLHDASDNRQRAHELSVRLEYLASVLIGKR